MSLDRTILIIAVATLMSACHTFSRGVPDCHRPKEYQRAVQMAPLKVPLGLDTPNTQGALLIPTVELAAPAPGPNTACLDAPPRYKPAPPTKAGSS
jgi:uncharacterized lipoprotein